ncbi:hypothetical protein Uis1B_2206 [Bifidobacterium margollesii]|uniref:Uncharacterized protein n=1 Tax=Bifidobacterium margollesii TaxID=2020964 RepID=A0A2N5J6V9_9BIFI|nr:hypothetical protein [Bifidobacterium margollesii]PLS29938.1 hypothetical protein Uis1B_2206 [Bifidobacterium margollesii]
MFEILLLTSICLTVFGAFGTAVIALEYLIDHADMIATAIILAAAVAVTATRHAIERARGTIARKTRNAAATHPRAARRITGQAGR